METEIEKETEKANEGRCESRIAKKGYFINFGNKKGRCFLEFRCDKKAAASGLCSNCLKKTTTCRTQDTRTFDHGRVSEYITEKSQIYGGAWYYEQVEKNGEPISSDIEVAIQHQKEARKGFPQLNDMELYVKSDSIATKAAKLKATSAVKEKEKEVDDVFEELENSKRSTTSSSEKEKSTRSRRGKKEDESVKTKSRKAPITQTKQSERNKT